MKIGNMFDSFVKRNLDHLFPADSFIADYFRYNNVDARPAHRSATGLPLEAKYAKLGAGLSGATLHRDGEEYYHGMKLQAQLLYSTAGTNAGPDASEFALASQGASHQVVLM